MVLDTETTKFTFTENGPMVTQSLITHSDKSQRSKNYFNLSNEIYYKLLFYYLSTRLPDSKNSKFNPISVSTRPL